LNSVFSPYISEVEDVIFARKVLNDAQLPADCKNVRVNSKYPSLPKPIILLTPQPVADSQLMKAMNHWSPHDLTVWIESMNQTSMRVCMKSVRFSMKREAVRVTYTIFPRLCDNVVGWEFFDGNCYYKHSKSSSKAQAAKTCKSKNATLPTPGSVDDADYLNAQAGRSGESTWLQIQRNSTKNMWAWQDGSQFTRWTKVSGPATAKCAITKGGAVIGWNNVDCNQTNSVVCERAARLTPTSCKNFTCSNDGRCVAMNEGPACQCKTGYGGRKCQTKLSDLAACKNNTKLDQSKRSLHSNTSGGFCDTSLNGWYRFSSTAGTKILEHCPEANNVCGGKYPGWIEGDNPTVNEGEVTRTLRFYRFSCTDDIVMKVGVQNCGGFLAYKFHTAASAACDLTVCNAV